MSRKRKVEESGYKPVRLNPRTPNQTSYIRAMKESDVTICLGPAGCGKTHVAIGLAVQMIRAEMLDRLILARPLVSVGREMGYLPGDIQDKLGPYIQPCFDELNYYLSFSMISQWMHEGKIEILPLSMMRGRTFNNAFVILDEAQNATRPEIKTFLTRMGDPVCMVLAGDPEQSDLPLVEQGALEDAADKLEDIVAVVELGAEDIVRNDLIAEISRRLW